MGDFKSNLKKLRTEKQMTQQDLAEKLYVTRQCISKWELGKVIPDIQSLERISQVFGCTINDLFDDESTKKLVIQNAIHSKKRDMFIKLGIAISFFAIILTIVLFIVTRQNDNKSILNTDIKYTSILSEVESINYSDKSMTVNTKSETLKYNRSNLEEVEVYNNKEEIVPFTSIKEFDYLKIEIMGLSTIKKIIIIDSQTNDNLKGIFVSSTGINYKTEDDLPKLTSSLSYDGFRYFYFTDDSESWNFYNISTKFNFSEYCKEKVFDIIVNFDKDVARTLHIGLIYDSGIIMSEDIIKDYHKSFQYKGEYSYETDYISIHSYEYIFNVKFVSVYSTDQITIFEYDKFGDFIKETVLKGIIDISSFSADPNAITAKVLIDYGMGLTHYKKQIINLNLGDTTNFTFCDTKGFISEKSFYYQVQSGKIKYI